MSRLRLVALVLLARLGAASLGAAQEPDPGAEQRLLRSDAYLSPNRSFRARQEVLFFKERRKEREMRIRVEALYRPQTDRSEADPPGRSRHDLLVVVLEPDEDRGKALLNHEGRVWYAAPRAQKPTRISERQNVAGRLTIADLLRAAYLPSYLPLGQDSRKVRLDRTESIEAVRLVLAARPESTGYPRVELFLDPADDRPLQAQAFDRRYRLLKTFLFRDFEPTLGVELPMKVIVVQATGKKAIHEIRTTSIEAADPPPAWFEPERLLETAASLVVDGQAR